MRAALGLLAARACTSALNFEIGSLTSSVEKPSSQITWLGRGVGVVAQAISRSFVSGLLILNPENVSK